MPRVVFYPFCSQQNKVTDKFLMSDSCVRIYAHLAKLIDDSLLVLPERGACEGNVDTSAVYRIWTSYVSNLERKFHWDPSRLRELARLAGDGGVVVTSNEFLPIPMRHLHPHVKTIVEATLPAKPEQLSLYSEGWNCANFVYALSSKLRDDVWPFGYETNLLQLRSSARVPRSILFSGRISDPDYTNYAMFAAAAKKLRGVRVYVSDPTGYGRRKGIVPASWSTSESYERLLATCEVSVHLTENVGSTVSFREACAAGCCPVVLRKHEYTEVIGPKWPHFADRADLVASIEGALQAPAQVPLKQMLSFSFDEAAKTAVADIRRILSCP